MLNHSITKAFKLLDYFTDSKPEWGVRELALATGANKSTIYRMLATMEAIDVLKKDKISEKYSLGLKLFELGNRVDIKNAFTNKTHPELEKVAQNITETVHLGILKNNQVLMVDKVESPQGLKISSVIGMYSPLYCTGLGKVLLAHSTEKNRLEALSKINLQPKTEQTITHIKDLQQELTQIKQQGYAIDKEELELGLICVAVPVFNQQHKIVAGLSAAGPANRFREEALAEYVEILKKGAIDIQHKIGNFTI